MYKPMLADMAREPFDDPDWAFEPKWDGVRALSYGGSLVARSGSNLTRQFPELVLPKDAVLDGEIVTLDDQGRPSFSAVAGRTHLQDGFAIRVRAQAQPVLYIAFDLLEIRGQPLVRRPLSERRAMLVRVVPAAGPVFFTPQARGEGVELFSRLRALGMEGIMAKRLDSPYQPGVRSRDWLKVKVSRQGEFWVIGVSEGEGRREGLIGALVLAEETPQGLVGVGEVGTGFSDEDLRALTRLLQGMKTERPAVAAPVEKLWFWVQPALKVKVSYLERTADGRLRFPAYRGRA